MFKKLKKMKNSFLVTAIMAMTTVTAFAGATEPKSMLSDDVKGIVQDFSADIVPTVIDLLALLIPVGLTLWAIGFAAKKGINFIQKKAKKAV